MDKFELIGAFAWMIGALSHDNKAADELLQVLKDKNDIQVIVKLYKEEITKNRFFPEES